MDPENEREEWLSGSFNDYNTDSWNEKRQSESSTLVLAVSYQSDFLQNHVAVSYSLCIFSLESIVEKTFILPEN